MTSSPLRIAWIIYGGLDQVSGGYIYDRLVVEQLRELGDEVTVISLSPGVAPPSLGSDFDVLLGDELCFRELLPIFEAGVGGPLRVLLVHHLTAWEHALGAVHDEILALEKAVIDAADVCIATSHVTADRLHAEGLARRVKVAVPGADRLPRPESGGQEPSGARLRLLFVGNILRRKRVRELCEAVASLATPSVELVLVGAELEPDYAAEVRACVAAQQLTARVRFLGGLSAAGVAEQLELADALVLPSALEGYGMVLSEALWAATPVIAARVGAAEQLIGQTGAGLLYEPDDDAALGATLGTFAADAVLRGKLRRAAWDAAEILPRWRDTARAVRAVLTRS
jgi:glycosyltransferase involved in cell wall biosynthesis